MSQWLQYSLLKYEDQGLEPQNLLTCQQGIAPHPVILVLEGGGRDPQSKLATKTSPPSRFCHAEETMTQRIMWKSN